MLNTNLGQQPGDVNRFAGECALSFALALEGKEIEIH